MGWKCQHNLGMTPTWDVRCQRVISQLQFSMGCFISTCSVCFSLISTLNPKTFHSHLSCGSRGPGTLRGLSMATPAPPQRRSGTQAPQSRCHIRNSLPKDQVQRAEAGGIFSPGPRHTLRRSVRKGPQTLHLETASYSWLLPPRSRAGVKRTRLPWHSSWTPIREARASPKSRRLSGCGPTVLQFPHVPVLIDRVVQESCLWQPLYELYESQRCVESCKGLGSVAEINDRWPRLRETILRFIKIYLPQKNLKRVRLEEQPLRQVT